jgi:hypothetical protein
MSDDLHSRSIKAAEVRQFLEGSLCREMFGEVSDYLETKALACDTKDHERAADILRCKQLLAQMRRALERMVEDGEVASFQMEQLEKRRGLARVFQR